MKKHLKEFEIMWRSYFKVFEFYALEFKCAILSLIAVLFKGLLDFGKKRTIWIIGENFGENLKDINIC